MSRIDPTAVISSEAEIDASVEIGPHVVIDGPVRIGSGVRIIAQAHITGETEIGPDCVIHPFVAIGGAPQDYGHKNERSFCRIGAKNVIREGVTIHRATGEGNETIVGDGCMFMAYSHVAHNCRVGSNVILTNGALLAGHVKVGDRAILGGLAAVHQFVRIGEYAMVGGLSPIRQDLSPFMSYAQDGRCLGVNRIGLRRNGFSSEAIDELRMLHRHLFRQRPASIRDTASQLLKDITTAAGRRLLEFVLAESKRGLAVRVAAHAS